MTFKMFIIIILIWWHKINIYGDYEHIVFKDSSHFRHSVHATDVADADYDDYDDDDKYDDDDTNAGDDAKILHNIAEKSCQHQTVANMLKSSFICFWSNHKDLITNNTL